MQKQDREKRIAERRARLAAIRKKREDRKNKKKGPAATPAASSPSPTAAKRSNIDDLVSSLLQKPPKPAVAEVIKTSAASPTAAAGNASPAVTPTASSAGLSTFSAEAKLKTLQMSLQCGEVSFGSQAKVTYARASQTTDDLLTAYTRSRKRRGSVTSIGSPSPRGSSTNEMMADAAAAAALDSISPHEEDDNTDVPQWTHEQKEEAMSTPEFSQFITRASKISERAIFLNKNFDLMVEYGKTTNESNVEAEKIALNADLYVEKMCGNRTLTKIAWSPQYSELLLGCYNSSSSLGHHTTGTEPDGNVFVWSLNTPTVPEMTFTCQSPILTAEFHPHSANLVIGGAYSGQIILWDMRAGHTPVQRTMSTDGHSLPVYSLQILGGKNLVSISTDGKLRLWDVNQLATPKVARNLCWPPKSEADNAVAVTAAALTHNENMITVGSESGQVYKVQILGANPGVQQSYDGHFGMVTDLHNHPGERTSLSNLVLSSGIDWSVKLWNLNKSTNNMLRSFSSSTNYVFSARWSPIHPTLFASCDAAGTLDFWDISHSMEVPVHTVRGDATGRARACSSLRWAKDGRKIATGSLDGHVRVYDVKNALADPKPDAVAKLEANLNRINEQMNEEAAMAAANASKDLTDDPIY